MPGNVNSLPAWDLGNGNWLLADQDLDYSVAPQRSEGFRAMSAPLELGSGADGSGAYSFDTNALWLEITNVVNGQAYLNLHNGTNFVYEIWSKQDLNAPAWDIETEVFPGTNQTVMPFGTPEAGRTNLFVWARDWTGITSLGNETPEWWFWKYFHTIDLSDTNSDSMGNTLLSDYQGGHDPNVIFFSLQFTNYWVNTSPAFGAIDILGGGPSCMAVLVDDTNFADALWQPFSSNVPVALIGDGNHSVWIGLRGFPADGAQSWEPVSLTLDTRAPVLTITNPITSVLSQSPISIKGYANEALNSLTFDISNAIGILTNQSGLLAGAFYDTNLLAFTTNNLECPDIDLAVGTNLVTLHATDWAGNATDLTLVLDYLSDTNPPVVSLVWPQDGDQVSGTNLALEARVDDASATVIAVANGVTAQGLVERSGTVWVQNLPILSGTNAITLFASNALGGVRTVSLNVVQNDVGLVIYPLGSNQWNQPFVNVSGSVNDPTDLVSVNGSVVGVNLDDSWEADHVSVSASGTASLMVQVYDSNFNLIASQTLNQPQPPVIGLMSYFGHIHYKSKSVGSGWFPDTEFGTQDSTISWSYSSGGNDHEHMTSTQSDDPPVSDSEYALSPDSNGVAGVTAPWQNCQDEIKWHDGNGDTVAGIRSVATRVMIQPAGREPAGQTNLYLLWACASEVSNPTYNDGYFPVFRSLQNPPDFYYGDLPLPPEWLQIQGQTLLNSGITNDDGAVWGQTLIAAPAGKNVDVTPVATTTHANNDYTFTNKVQEVQLELFANGIDLSTTNPEFCVGQQVVLSNAFDPPLPQGTQVAYQWVADLDFGNDFLSTASPDGSSQLYINTALLTNSSARLWWYSGGAKRVWCIATVQLPSGHSVQVESQAAVSIYRPVIDDFIDSPPAFATNAIVDGVFSLSLGNGNVGDMEYEVDILSKYAGRADITQLVNRQAANGNTSSSTSGFWLDNFRFIIVQSNDPDAARQVRAGTDARLLFGDGPYFPLAHSAFNDITSIVDSFQDYVIFRPDAGNAQSNIYVCLGTNSWSWSAATTYSNSQWSVPTFFVTRPIRPDASNLSPIWPRTYINGN